MLRERAIVVALWALSRAAVFVMLLVVAPRLGPLPDASPVAHWYDVLARWDGAWYGEIARAGYTLPPDGAKSDLAFFPLFPLLAAAVGRLGIPFPLAGAIVANGAFLAMLFVVAEWARRRFDVASARWIVATLCLLPLSLFGSVGYAESTAMLCVAVGLRALDAKRPRLAALGGFFAGLARAPGVLLAVPFAFRRSPAALAPLAGAATFAAYARLRFGDFFATEHAQKAWRSGAGFDYRAWHEMARVGLDERHAQHVGIALASVVVSLGRDRVPRAFAVAYWLVVVSLLCRWWAPQFENVLLVVVAAAAVVGCARVLGRDLVAFAVAVLAAIAFSGEPLSVDRIAYGSLVLPIALALFFRRAPYVGTALLTIAFYDLCRLALVFGRGGWVA